MNAASPLRAALLASVTRRGQWVGPTLVIAAALLALLAAVPRPLSIAPAAGWLGAVAFVLSLALTVRARGLAARFGGLDHQYAWHHLLGLVAWLAVLAHALAALAPLTARGAGIAVLAQWFGGALLASGWAALALLLLPLAATFYGPRDFRAWLGWHRLAAAAFVVLAAHVLLATQGAPAAWASAAGGLGALAARAWVQHRAAGRRHVVVDVVHPADACVEVTLEPVGRALRVQPGQYVFAAFHDGAGYHSCNEYHPFTVSRVQGRRLTLTIKALGDCTREMQQLAAGLAAWVEGPFGAFFERTRPDAPQLWIAGGIGVTPFLAQLDRLGRDVDLKMAYLFRRGGDALHIDELQAAADARPAMELFTFVSATDLSALMRWLDAVDVTAREIYVCGPPPLLDAVVGYLERRGVAAARVHFERFDFR
jgi:predicted ferric reductase